MGFSDLMQSGIDLENTVEYAGIINKSGHHLLNMIEDIFELAITESSGIKLRKETFKILDLFLISRSTLTEIRDASGKKINLNLFLDLIMNLLTVKLLPTRIRLPRY